MVGQVIRAVGESDRSERELALQLTETVHNLVSMRNHTFGYSRASQVVRNAEGDCTEQAVLLAALLRAKKIPARLAIGMVYKPGQQPQMIYHMWTLAYVDDHWLSLDATTGEIASADRITFATTHLGDGNEFITMTPIIAALGNLEIEIVDSDL